MTVRAGRSVHRRVRREEKIEFLCVLGALCGEYKFASDRRDGLFYPSPLPRLVFGRCF